MAARSPRGDRAGNACTRSRWANERRSLVSEVGAAVQQLGPERLILLVPTAPGQYKAFREMTERFFPHGLPQYAGERPGRSLAALRA